jgi:DNA-binding GntR family transcriptional regulator
LTRRGARGPIRPVGIRDSGYKPLRLQRLVDDATQALRDAILTGKLPEGARLRQVELADRLGISRTPIREALGRLQHEGLVDLLPRSGVRVTPFDVDEAVELYDLREMLDGLAARLAAGRADTASLARLDKTLARMERCLAGNDTTHWFAAHVLFHDEIFRASGNGRLAALSSVVQLSIRRFHPLLLKTERRLDDAYREHRAIADAIAAHDGEAAERLARTHITNAREIVLKVMTREVADGAVQA